MDKMDKLLSQSDKIIMGTTAEAVHGHFRQHPRFSLQKLKKVNLNTLVTYLPSVRFGKNLPPGNGRNARFRDTDTQLSVFCVILEKKLGGKFR